MKKKSIRYAIAGVICVALLVVFSHTIGLVEVEKEIVIPKK